MVVTMTNKRTYDYIELKFPRQLHLAELCCSHNLEFTGWKCRLSAGPHNINAHSGIVWK